MHGTGPHPYPTAHDSTLNGRSGRGTGRYRSDNWLISQLSKGH